MDPEKSFAPLLVATVNNDTDLALALIDAWGDVNVAVSGFLSRLFCACYSALHYAVKNDNEQLVKYLISRGARICESEEVPSPLHVAVRHNRESIVRIPLSCGANVNATLKYSTGKWVFEKTPLYYAKEFNCTEEIKKILRNYGGVSQNLFEILLARHWPVFIDLGVAFFIQYAFSIRTICS